MAFDISKLGEDEKTKIFGQTFGAFVLGAIVGGAIKDISFKLGEKAIEHYRKKKLEKEMSENLVHNSTWQTRSRLPPKDFRDKTV